MLNKTGYRYDTDIWSIGALLYIMLFDEKPFKGEDKEQIYKQIKKLDYCFPKHTTVSEDAYDLIWRIFVENYRLTLD